LQAASEAGAGNAAATTGDQHVSGEAASSPGIYSARELPSAPPTREPLTSAGVTAELMALGPQQGALDVSKIPCQITMLVQGNPVRINSALERLGWKVKLADDDRGVKSDADQPILEIKSPSMTLAEGGIEKLLQAVGGLRDAQAEGAGPMQILIPQKLGDKELMSQFGEINFVHMHRANDDVLYRIAANGQVWQNLKDKEGYALPLSQDHFRGDFYKTVESERQIPKNVWVGGRGKGYGHYERQMVARVMRDRVRLDDNDWRGKLADGHNALNSSVPGHWQLRYFDSTTDPQAAAADVALVLGMVKAAQEGRGTWKGSITDGGALSDVYDRPVDKQRFDQLMGVLVGEGAIKAQLESQFTNSGGKLGTNADIHLWNTLHTDVLDDSNGANVNPTTLPSFLTLEPPAAPPAVRWVNDLSVDQRRTPSTQPLRNELLAPEKSRLAEVESSSGEGFERFVSVDRANGSVHAGYHTKSGLHYEEVQAPLDVHSYFRADVDFALNEAKGYPVSLEVRGAYGQDGVHVEAHKKGEAEILPASVTPEGRILIQLGGLNAFIDPSRMEYGLATGTVSDGSGKTREVQKEVYRADLSSYLVVDEERTLGRKGEGSSQRSQYLKVDYAGGQQRAEAVTVTTDGDGRNVDRKKLRSPGEYFVHTAPPSRIASVLVGERGARFLRRMGHMMGFHQPTAEQQSRVRRLSEDALALALQVSLAPTKVNEQPQ
jgi:hypothetical protein